jgi:hypothetical protein
LIEKMEGVKMKIIFNNDGTITAKYTPHKLASAGCPTEASDYEVAGTVIKDDALAALPEFLVDVGEIIFFPYVVGMGTVDTVYQKHELCPVDARVLAWFNGRVKHFSLGHKNLTCWDGLNDKQYFALFQEIAAGPRYIEFNISSRTTYHNYGGPVWFAGVPK